MVEFTRPTKQGEYFSRSKGYHYPETKTTPTKDPQREQAVRDMEAAKKKEEAKKETQKVQPVDEQRAQAVRDMEAAQKREAEAEKIKTQQQDIQRAKAVADMEAAKAREAEEAVRLAEEAAKIEETIKLKAQKEDVQREKAVADMKAAQKREAEQKKQEGIYRRLDVAVGGILPGGVPTIRAQVKKEYEILGKEAEDVNKAVENLESFEKFVDKDKFIGSEKDYARYETSFAKYGKEYGEYLKQQEKLKLKEVELEKTPLQKVLRKYEKAEEWAKKEITYPIAEQLYKITGKTIEEQAKESAELYSKRQFDFEWLPKEYRLELPPPTPADIEFHRGLSVGLVSGIKEKPVKTAAILGISYAVGPTIKLVGWGTRALGVPAIISKVPGATKAVSLVGKGLKFGLPATYIGVKGYEVAAAPTYYEKGYVVGEALTTEVAPMIAGSVFGSKLANRIASKEMIHNQIKELSPSQQIKFKEYMKVIKEIQKTGTPPVKKVTLEGMDRLPSQGRPATLKYLKTISNKGDILGGSISQRTQTYGVQRSYSTSDLDLYTKSSSTQRALDYAKVLTNAGIKRVAVVPGTGRVTIAGNKVAEWHPMSAYNQNIYEAEGWYKPVITTITKDPSGIRVMKVTSQWKRKLIGSYLQGRYAKDYPDLKLITKSMYETARLKGIIKTPKIKILDFKPPKDIKIITTYPSVYKTPIKTAPYPSVYKDPLKITTYPSVYKAPLKVTPYFYGIPKKISPFIYPYKLPKVDAIIPYIGKPLKEKVIPYVSKPTKVDTAIPYISKTKEKITPYISEPTKEVAIPYAKPPKEKVVPYTKPPKVEPYVPPIKPYKDATPYKPPIVTPIKPLITIPAQPELIVPMFRPRKKIKKKKLIKGQGYYAYGKKIGTQKYVKLHDNPVTMERAKDIGSYMIDTSLSTNFLIKPTTKKVGKTKLPIPEGYYSRTKKKYRDYKFRTIEGVRKRKPLKNKWIERTSGKMGTSKKGFRLDTIQERKRITLLARRAQLRKKIKKIVKNKKKGGKINIIKW